MADQGYELSHCYVKRSKNLSILHTILDLQICKIKDVYHPRLCSNRGSIHYRMITYISCNLGFLHIIGIIFLFYYYGSFIYRIKRKQKEEIRKYIYKNTIIIWIIRGIMNALWKIYFLVVNGQSFLVIDGYLLNPFRYFSLSSRHLFVNSVHQ